MQKSRCRWNGFSKRRFSLLLLLKSVVLVLWLCWSTIFHRVSSQDVAGWWSKKILLPGQDWKVKGYLEVLVPSLPLQNDLSRSLHRKNQEQARNRDLFPRLAEDHVKIVLYVHNRPQYLRLAIDALSKVKGINETLLIVSHDGNFDEMNAIVTSIRFCQVKQIFAVYSPHLFQNAFPGQSPDDCVGNNDPVRIGCKGNPDQYGNYRSPRIVSLKHHWWWMMNTVWDGLAETNGNDGHILFIEEDHYLLPNAYRTIQILSTLKSSKCLECTAVNLSPSFVHSRGERNRAIIVEKTGNMGYAFNRSVWYRLRAGVDTFCAFDDYNWDVTLWSAVYPKWEPSGYSLRSSRPSALHIGKCGLHQGQEKGKPTCFDGNQEAPQVAKEDLEPFVHSDWPVVRYAISGYKRGFTGWGGWGDKRDQKLCGDFAQIYRK